jgi:branched-chain amino acid transport system ATP-binding protein
MPRETTSSSNTPASPGTTDASASPASPGTTDTSASPGSTTPPGTSASSGGPGTPEAGALHPPPSADDRSPLMATHALVAGDITVRYGHAIAVRGVDVSVPGGSVTAIVGPNGAGKSSLLLALYGSVDATGQVTLDGDDVSRLRATARARAGIALVPQGRQLFPRLTVRENLQLMVDLLRSVPRSAVDEALDRFPILRQRARRLAGVLSGGEQQMLVVARALMGRPRVLLLDEMTTGLAPMIVRELSDTVAGLAADGVAVALAEPSLAPVQRIVDRGVVLIRGEVRATAESSTDLDRSYQTAMGVTYDESPHP